MLGFRKSGHILLVLFSSLWMSLICERLMWMLYTRADQSKQKGRSRVTIWNALFSSNITSQLSYWIRHIQLPLTPRHKVSTQPPGIKGHFFVKANCCKGVVCGLSHPITLDPTPQSHPLEWNTTVSSNITSCRMGMVYGSLDSSHPITTPQSFDPTPWNEMPLFCQMSQAIVWAWFVVHWTGHPITLDPPLEWNATVSSNIAS